MAGEQVPWTISNRERLERTQRAEDTRLFRIPRTHIFAYGNCAIGPFAMGVHTVQGERNWLRRNFPVYQGNNREFYAFGPVYALTRCK